MATDEKLYSARKSEMVNVRMSPQHLDLVSRAAEIVGESRADFIRNSSNQRAVEILKTAHLLEAVQPKPGEVA